jgi:hypothetical protein
MWYIREEILGVYGEEEEAEGKGNKDGRRGGRRRGGGKEMTVFRHY